MLHCHAVEEVDGVASTEDDPHLVKEHVFVISDDPDYGKIHQTAKKKKFRLCLSISTMASFFSCKLLTQFFLFSLCFSFEKLKRM